MSEVADRLALPCPSCSPEFDRAHEVLKERGQMYTVRCTECGHVHKERVEPDETVEEWFELTDEARKAAIDAVEPGVEGEAIHDAACDVYEDAGLPTLRSDEAAETGFIHSTGHGVGLDVHEGPRIGPGVDVLEPGHVITIEPGLYDPDVGGVRIEDLVVVTEDGSENLTDYRVELEV